MAILDYLGLKEKKALNKFSPYFNTFAGEFIKNIISPAVGACALKLTGDPMLSVAAFSVASSMLDYSKSNNPPNVNIDEIRTICKDSLADIDINTLREQLIEKGIASEDDIDSLTNIIKCYKNGQLDFEKDVFAKFSEIENDVTKNARNIDTLFTRVAEIGSYDEIIASIESRINKIEDRVKLLENFHSIIVNVKEHSKIITNNNTKYYNYRNRVVPLVGRKDEFEQLINFIFNEKSTHNFGWYSIKGAGGIGKSRLALELCLHLNNVYNWDAGFYHHKQDISIALNWLPHKPTLIVIDYISSQPKLFAEIICSLAERSSEFLCPVRLIALDRESGSSYLDEMYKYFDPNILDFFNCGTMILSLLDSKYLWEIFTAICKVNKQIITVSKHDFIDSLKESNTFGKPLFSIISALSYIKNTKLSLSYAKLLDVGINEYERVWDRYKCTEQEVNLIVLSTLTQGISINNENNDLNVNRCKSICQCTHECIGYIDLFESNDIIFPPDSDKTICRHQFFVERSDNNILLPLEPDIIGEAYVLKIFTARSVRFKNKLRSFAWMLNPPGTALFLNRLIQDFLINQNSEEKDLIFELMSPPSDKNALECWKQYTPHILSALFTAGLFDDLVALSLVVSNYLGTSKSDRIIKSRASVNLIVTYCIRNNINKALELYNESYETSQLYNNEELITLHCRNAANISYSYWQNGRVDEIFSLYNDIKPIVMNDDCEEQYYWLIVLIYNYCNACVEYDYIGKLVGARKDVLDVSIFDVLGEKKSTRINKYQLAVEMIQFNYYVFNSNYEQALSYYNNLSKNKKFKDNTWLSRTFLDFGDSSLVELKYQMLYDFAGLSVNNRSLNTLIDIINELKLISDINNDYKALHELIIQCKDISRQNHSNNINKYLVNEERKLHEAHKTIDFLPESIEENKMSIEKQMQASSIEEMVEEFFANQFRKKMRGEDTRFKQPEFVKKSIKKGEVLKAIKKNPNKYKGQINAKVLTKIMNANLHGSLGEVNEFYDSISSKLPNKIVSKITKRN